MPYKTDYSGVYVLKNTKTGQGYIGQSSRVKKRCAEHLRLLRNGAHPNGKLQEAADAYGVESFAWELVVACDDPEEMTIIEEAGLQGDAYFDVDLSYNISAYAFSPMKGRRHSRETKTKISRSKIGRVYSDEERARLSEARKRIALRDPSYRDKVKFLLQNGEMSYAERARHVGMDTSTARKVALRYSHMKGKL